MIYETQEQLDEAVAYWQKVLRLQDWNIEAKIKRTNDMRADTMGTVVPCWNWKSAYITLIDPLDFEQDPIVHNENCHESILVHELLHLHTRPILRSLGKPEGQDDQEETCVNLIADALVRLKAQIPATT